MLPTGSRWGITDIFLAEKKKLVCAFIVLQTSHRSILDVKETGGGNNCTGGECFFFLCINCICTTVGRVCREGNGE